MRSLKWCLLMKLLSNFSQYVTQMVCINFPIKAITKDYSNEFTPVSYNSANCPYNFSSKMDSLQTGISFSVATSVAYLNYFDFSCFPSQRSFLFVEAQDYSRKLNCVELSYDDFIEIIAEGDFNADITNAASQNQVSAGVSKKPGDDHCVVNSDSTNDGSSRLSWRRLLRLTIHVSCRSLSLALVCWKYLSQICISFSFFFGVGGGGGGGIHYEWYQNWFGYVTFQQMLRLLKEITFFRFFD